jgi:VWFA-related protein
MLNCLMISILLCYIGDIVAGDDSSQTNPKQTERKQTFKVSTDLMEVHAVVTDPKGRVVENLKKEDFLLLENDQPQEISFFSVSQVENEKCQPSNAVAAQDNTRRAVSLPEQLSTPPARTTVLYVDNLHLSFSSLNWAKREIRQFVDERLTPQDSIALVTSGSNLGIAQQFTRDRQMLNYAIERIDYKRPADDESKFTPYLAARVILGDNVATTVAARILESEGGKTAAKFLHPRAMQILSQASYFRETTLLTLKALIEQMIGMPGQRMIAIFSEGFSQHGRDGWPKYDEVRSAINRAIRSGVVIYSIDAKGLQAPVDAKRDTDPEDKPEIAHLINTMMESYKTTAAHEKLDALSALAKDTGGELYMNTNDLSGMLGRAFDANHYYYVLSYYLKPGADPDKFRKIKVLVRNHPEYKIRTARGFAPADANKAQEDEMAMTPQQRLIRAVNAPLPLTHLNVSAWADFVGNEAERSQVVLAVQFDGNTLQYRQQDQGRVFAVEILYVVYDTAGKQVDSASTRVEGILTSERLAQAQTNGYMFSKRLTLKPGAYQVRVGVREEGTDLMGTASTWIEVPDLARSKLALSSLMFLDPLLEDVAVKDANNEGELKLVKTVQGVRLYPHNIACGYFFRLYRGLKAADVANLAMKLELLKDAKSVMQSRWRSLPIRKKDIDSKGWAYVGQKLDLTALNPGIYELSVSVRDPKSKIIAQRSAVFGVE